MPPNLLDHGFSDVDLFSEVKDRIFVPTDEAYQHFPEEGVYYQDVHFNPDPQLAPDLSLVSQYIQMRAEDPFVVDLQQVRDAIADLCSERRQQYLNALEKSARQSAKVVVAANRSIKLQEHALNSSVAFDRPKDASKRYGGVSLHQNKRLVGRVIARKLMFHMHLVKCNPAPEGEEPQWKQSWFFAAELTPMPQQQPPMNSGDEAATSEVTMSHFLKTITHMRDQVIQQAKLNTLVSENAPTELTADAQRVLTKFMVDNDIKTIEECNSFINTADECHELGVHMWQHALDLNLSDLIGCTDDNEQTIHSIFYWLTANRFSFKCAATELWAREARCKTPSDVMPTATGHTPADCWKCLQTGKCQHACCRLMWERIGLKNKFLKPDGEGGIRFSDGSREALQEEEEEEEEQEQQQQPQEQEQQQAEPVIEVKAKSDVLCIAAYLTSDGDRVVELPPWSMTDDDFVDQFELDDLDTESLRTAPGLEYFVHHQQKGSVPSLEVMDLIGDSGGQGTWTPGRHTGGTSGLYCYHSSMLEIVDDDTGAEERRIELHEDCYTLIFALPRYNGLEIKETADSEALQELAKATLYSALKYSIQPDAPQWFEGQKFTLGRLMRELSFSMPTELEGEDADGDVDEAAAKDALGAHIANLVEQLCGPGMNTQQWRAGVQEWCVDVQMLLGEVMDDAPVHGLITQPVNCSLTTAGYNVVVDKVEEYPGRKYGSIILDEDVVADLMQLWKSLPGNKNLIKWKHCDALDYGRAAKNLV